MKNIIKNWLGITSIEGVVKNIDATIGKKRDVTIASMYRDFLEISSIWDKHYVPPQSLHERIDDLQTKITLLESYLKIEQVHDPAKTYYAPVKRK